MLNPRPAENIADHCDLPYPASLLNYEGLSAKCYYMKQTCTLIHDRLMTSVIPHKLIVCNERELVNLFARCFSTMIYNKNYEREKNRTVESSESVFLFGCSSRYSFNRSSWSTEQERAKISIRCIVCV